MIEGKETRKFIIFCEEHYNPLGMVRTLGEHKISPIVILLKNQYKLIEKSKYPKKILYVDTVEAGYELLIERFGKEQPKPVVLTSDDTITGFLDEHYDDLKDKYIFYNAGEKGRITKFSNKKTILDCAKRNGLDTLPTVLVSRGELSHGIEYPIITKARDPLMYGWKSDMRICETEKELVEAYKTIRSEKVLIQKFIEKDNEYCIDGMSWNRGKSVFYAIASTYDYSIKGNYGPYMTITSMNVLQLEEGLNRMFAEIGFEGIFSVEFLKSKEGKYYFSEINFRNSTWSYAATRLGMPLPILWMQAMTGNLSNSYKKSIPDNYKAMVEFDDFRHRVRGKQISFIHWLKDFNSTGCKYYAGYKDSRPFVYSIIYRGYSFVRKKMKI